MDKLVALREAIIGGRMPEAVALSQQVLDDGMAVGAIYPGAVVPAMDEVGRRMASGEFYLPEVLVAARAAKAVGDHLRPLLVGDERRKTVGTIVFGTVQGDLHDVGKNIVAMMLEGAEFRIVDLGVDVAPERFVEAARSEHADLVAISALLTTTMGNMEAVIAAIDAAGLRPAVRVIVGGAPVSAEFARSIDADGFAQDAPRAVELARSLVNSGVQSFGLQSQ